MGGVSFVEAAVALRHTPYAIRYSLFAGNGRESGPRQFCTSALHVTGDRPSGCRYFPPWSHSQRHRSWRIATPPMNRSSVARSDTSERIEEGRWTSRSGAEVFAVSRALPAQDRGRVQRLLVKLAKLQGEFLWHHHDNEDELFLVVKGELRMKVRENGDEREFRIKPGEFIIIPRGVGIGRLPMRKRASCCWSRRARSTPATCRTSERWPSWNGLRRSSGAGSASPACGVGLLPGP